MAVTNPYQAQYTINDLIAGTQPTGAEVAEFIQGGLSVKLSFTQLLAATALLVNTAQLNATLGTGLINFTANNVNFNAANTDTPITITPPTGFTTYRVNALYISDASVSLTTATCGLFTAAAGGGFAVVTGGSAITVNTPLDNVNNNMQLFAINNGTTQAYNLSTLYFRVGTAQGVAATGNVTVQIVPFV